MLLMKLKFDLYQGLRWFSNKKQGQAQNTEVRQGLTEYKRKLLKTEPDEKFIEIDYEKEALIKDLNDVYNLVSDHDITEAMERLEFVINEVKQLTTHSVELQSEQLPKSTSFIKCKKCGGEYNTRFMSKCLCGG
jgi:hypothetical protein